MGEYTVHISEKTKHFLWLPAKTGTVHATFIFKHFDFVTRTKRKDEVRGEELAHHHHMDLFPNHEEYKLICTARNPFTRFISWFKYNTKTAEEVNAENFKRYFSELAEKNFIKNQYSFLKGRVPDYFIRMESLWYDYNKIPFIRLSKLNQSGVLYDLCQNKLNSTLDFEQEKDFYTPHMIDYVYENTKEYMDLLGYEYPY